MVVPLFDCRTACSLFGAGPCCGRGNLSSSSSHNSEHQVKFRADWDRPDHKIRLIYAPLLMPCRTGMAENGRARGTRARGRKRETAER
jgi:hypothetical protein